jgi:ABC-type lipoprotein release transport system permease subunit
LGIYLLVNYAQLGNQLLQFQWQVLLPELLLLLLVILLGIFASVLPAYQASRIQISKTLSNA